MASSLLDFDALTKPVQEDAPAGSPLPYDVRAKLEDMRKEINPDDYDADDPRRPQSYRGPDWPGIIDLATDTLINKSKDLLVAARLCEALVMQHQFAGLRDGVELLHRLSAECWDRIHPIIEEGDTPEAREGPFKWLNEEKFGAQFPHTLRTTPLIAVDGKRFSFEAWQSKDRRPEFETAVSGISPETAQKLVDDVKAAKSGLNALSELLNEKMGDLAPDLVSSENSENLGAAINDCLKVANQILQRKSGAPEAGAESAPGAAGARSAGGSTVSLNLASRRRLPDAQRSRRLIAATRAAQPDSLSGQARGAAGRHAVPGIDESAAARERRLGRTVSLCWRRAACFVGVIDRPSGRPIRVRRDAQAKLGKQPRGPIQIVEADDFHRAVHIAIGNANQSGGDAAAGKLHGVGVSAGRARSPANLHGNFRVLGGFLEPLHSHAD